MKYLIVSDIHGSADSCHFLEQEFKNGGYDLIINAGDVLYHGPRNDLPENYRPKECIAILNPLADKIICVKGNCEAEVDQMVLNFKIHDFYDGTFNGHTVHLEHGHHLDLYTGHPEIIISGHTHIPVLEKKDGILYLNPGSMTIPKGGFPRSYAVMDEKRIQVLSLNGDIIYTYALESK